ncbi:ATP-binding protein [Rhodococcus qingshengii]|uniref:ATP-binding protein n=1 Tax=Rhodococcus qingshengii TaxID=334542 RepID=UPI00210AE4B6|nr:ATP-binding protein [Rhodococcus qingshengii]MCQ4152011.1 ATP-binding protein [Rhodococcus qingshengii]
MQLVRVHVRFFKSFNFDYERRAKEGAKRHDWEILPEGWYPHVRLNVDPQVTAVVGANESGKSHLLDAIECVMGLKEVKRSDFCRYSQLYSVETNEVRLPDLGAVFAVSQESETALLAALGVTCPQGGQFLFMRPGTGSPIIICDDTTTALDTDGVVELERILPRVLRYSTDVAIPDSVPITTLWGGDLGTLADRRTRSRFLDLAEGVQPADANEFAPLIPSFVEFLRPSSPTADTTASKRKAQESMLARQLLVDVARVDPSIFKDLQDAISNGNEGDVSGLVGKINQSLSRHLNFSRWWTQDSDFALRVSPRERELVFTIEDRTGTEYSFGERSRGLTHFLAYFVQLRAHRRDEKRAEILLMDEPDAYLSNSGQQDLLRVLENFAVPDDGARHDQVLYVTHSPFLINKNAAHRLRVLDKGSQSEGTRVVKDVARTHYEPLRSSLGAYVAETTFIGGKNLIVEGVADQVLLAGMSSALRLRGVSPDSLLDLNEVTIVPAGSADSVPYIAYLARGRDPVKPPCVALLDGDDDGERAAQKLKRSEVNRKPVLDQKYIVRLDTWAETADPAVISSTASGKVTEIEDLIPPRIAVLAARSYATRLLGIEAGIADKIKEVDLKTRLAASDKPLWDELRALFADTLDGERIDKVGFAREVVDYVSGLDYEDPRPSGVPALEGNFTSLLNRLSELLNHAAVAEYERRRAKRMGRVVRGFLDDYPDGASRSLADSRLREIEASLDEVASNDAFRLGIARLRRDFRLRDDPTKPIDDFKDFREQLDNLLHQERLENQDKEKD